MVWEALQGILFLGLIGTLTSSIAFKYGFFKLPSYTRPPVRFFHLISVFGIYLGFLFLLPIFLLKIINTSSLSTVMTIQFLLVVTMFATLLFYIRTEGQGSISYALKNPESKSSRWTDFGLGALVWFIAFPWVGVLSQFCDFILEAFFNFK